MLCASENGNNACNCINQSQHWSLFRQWLKKHVGHIYTSKHHEFQVVAAYFAHHPTWQLPEQWAKVEKIRLCTARINKAPAVRFKCFKKRNYLNVAWKKCLPLHLKKDDCASSPSPYQLTSAMRQAVDYQVIKWKRAHPSTACTYCGTDKQLQADHIKSFNSIKLAFLATRQDIPTQFKCKKSTGQARFLPTDVKFRHAWTTYHQQKAEFQWLCKECNLKKSDS